MAFCSRTLTSAEQKYAQLEKECLASVWACERFDRYLVGLEKFTLYSDHKPLIPLINTKDLSETPMRCQRMLIRLMRYKPVAEHRPGKLMLTSDALSHSPTACSEESTKLQSDVFYHVSVITSSWPVSDEKLEQIRCETQKDVTLKTALNYTAKGWPTYKEDVWLAARDLFGFRSELSVFEGLLLRGDQIVIPRSMRKEILQRIHDGHLGVTKCRERANQGVWWPGISKDIKDLVTACRHCLEKRPAQPSEPLITSSLPERPFQHIAVDICELKGQNYLISVDYYSRYIDIQRLTALTSMAVIQKLKAIFSQHGIPETIISDNGRQFSSREFQMFVKEWNFNHSTSSPHYPQANGEAERAVKTAKEILRQKDYHLALLTYRATPLSSLGVSPAELAFGRRLRTTLPTLPQNLKPRAVDPENVRKRDNSAKVVQKKYFDKKAQPLSVLKPGDRVIMQEEGEKGWKRPGEVVRQCAPRSFIVRTADGELRRNRKHLRLRSSTDGFKSGMELPELEPQEPALPAPESEQRQLRTPVQTPAPLKESPPQPAGPLVPEDLTPPTEKPPEGSSQPYITKSGRAIIKPARFR